MRDSDHSNELIEVEEEMKRSSLAAEIKEIAATVDRLSAERERLPQPLFWSLFHARMSKVRREKDIQRTLEKIFP